MKAAWLKAPFQFELKNITIGDPGYGEVLVKVKACCLCGHDLILASAAADTWQQFGHEISGVVEKIGPGVRNVAPGDSVVLESGTFDRFSDNSRNGRVDLDNKGPNFWIDGDKPMGFSEALIVPMETCVKFSGISFEEASTAEPLGVALDLATTGEIKLNDDVLVIGLGPIGLMAARLAKAMGARNVFGAELSRAKARIELAKKWGVEDVILTDQSNVADFPFPRGYVDRVLVTAPPKTIPSALEIAGIGGIVAFLGIEYGDGGKIAFDANDFHVKKLQLRSSFASPALYFPRCLELIRSGVIDAKALLTHRFALEDIASAIPAFASDRENGIKAVMTRD